MSPTPVAVVEMVGEFDISERERLARAFDLVTDVPVLVVDLSRTLYLDSTALNAFLEVNKGRAHREDFRPLRICGVSPRLEHIFTVTKLETILRIDNGSAAVPPDAMRLQVHSGRRITFGSIEDWAESLDALIRRSGGITSECNEDNLYRWTRGERQCQLHCVGEREAVLLRMHSPSAGRAEDWTPKAVSRYSIDETEPWEVAQEVTGFVSPGSREAAGANLHRPDRERG
jgi:anti-anti-sigma factor